MTKQTILIHMEKAGTRFGRLTMLGPRESGSRKVRCRCDCGQIATVSIYDLRRGFTKSCGCLRREASGARQYKHGAGYSDYRYRLWRSIKRRCLSPDWQDFSYYGGRGIRMDAAWIDDFSAFAAYLDSTLGPRPDGASLDRIDNDGNYGPGNLRWATRSEQARNRRKRRWYRKPE